MSDAREGDDERAGSQQPSIWKHWLSRFTDPIVLVALITAVASATFAYQTNRISQRQVELLDRQVAIEESLALPVFTVSMDVGNTSDGGTDSHRISIDNSGGLASDLSIDVLPYLSYWWTEEVDTGEPVLMQGDELPLVGYFDEYNHVLPTHLGPATEIVLGFDGNATLLREITDQLTGQLAAQDGVSELDHALELMVSLSYIDFAGVERSDYYVAFLDSNGDVFPPQQFIRVSATLGDEIWMDYYQNFDSQFMLILDPETGSPDPELVRTLGTRMYDQRYIEEDRNVFATPAARRSPAPPRFRAVSS